jgi:small conductance mechanosensitive channel
MTASLWRDVAAWTTLWDRIVTWLLGDGLRVLLTIVLALVVRWLAMRAIGRVVRIMTTKSTTTKVTSTGRAGQVLAQAAGLAHTRHVQRVTTLGSLLRSIVTFTVALIAVWARCSPRRASVASRSASVPSRSSRTSCPGCS